MKSTIIVIATILAMCVWCFVQAEDRSTEPPSTWRAQTGPGEVDSIDQVVVEQHAMQVTTWTLREVDYYITYYETGKADIEDKLIRLRALRENVLREAEKVRLKLSGDTSS